MHSLLILAATTPPQSGLHLSTSSVLAVIGIISFCLTAAGIIGMGFRVGSNTQAMANYRETAASWKQKSDAQEAQITELQSEMVKKDQQIAELNAKLELLQRMVLGESTAQRLEARLGEVYDHVQEMQAATAKILEKVLA